MNKDRPQVFYDPNQPRKHLIDALPYVQGRRALDIGAARGNNTRLLLDQGYRVVAIDPKAQNVVELNKLATPNLEVVQSSLEDFGDNDGFDLIVCTMVLHFLEPKDVPSAVAKLQKLTKVGGIDVVSVFTKENGRPKEYYKYYFASGELRSYYADWEILDYDELLSALPILKDGKRHKYARLIARRKL